MSKYCQDQTLATPVKLDFSNDFSAKYFDQIIVWFPVFKTNPWSSSLKSKPSADVKVGKCNQNICILNSSQPVWLDYNINIYFTTIKYTKSHTPIYSIFTRKIAIGPNFLFQPKILRSVKLYFFLKVMRFLSQSEDPGSYCRPAVYCMISPGGARLGLFKTDSTPLRADVAVRIYFLISGLSVRLFHKLLIIQQEPSLLTTQWRTMQSTKLAIHWTSG